MEPDNAKANDQGLDPNVIVKIEPGTTAPSTTAAATSAPLIPVANIKLESGPSTTRLTSFRAPRDLTLGGQVKLEKTKRTYTPNLNVQRNKNKDERSTPKNNARPNKERGRGRGQGARGRGRGRGSENVIQTAGVFSDGIATTQRPPRRDSGYRESGGRSSSSTALEKPKLNLDQKIDKAEEEEKLKNLLRDDFIENGAVPDMENAPVLLPLADEVKLYKEEEDDKLETKSTTGDGQTNVEDVKPVISENGEVTFDGTTHTKPIVKKSIKEGKKLITIPQLAADETNNYILIQLPDCLPGLRADGELSDTRQKKSTESATQQTEAEKPKSEYCTLSDLKEGLLGKLRIHQSGQAKLVLGDNNLLMEVGSHPSFRQDLIAAKLDMESLNGELINLGLVSSTLICSPDWESMLKNV